MNEPLQSTTPAPADSRPPRAVEQEKLQAIRDILVGDDFEILERRFQVLEHRHEAAYSKIGGDLMAKFETLQVLSKSQIEELGESLSETLSEFQKKDSDLSRELAESREHIADLERRVNVLQDSLVEQFRKMHEQVSTRMSELSRAIRAQQEEAAHETVSRKDFAKVLSRLADTVALDRSTPTAEYDDPVEGQAAEYAA